MTDYAIVKYTITLPVMKMEPLKIIKTNSNEVENSHSYCWISIGHGLGLTYAVPDIGHEIKYLMKPVPHG